MITTVTLNASIDKAYDMKTAIQDGTVMRVSECRNTAGGKGLNVARIIKLCGKKVQATGLAGGFNGKYLRSLLQNDGVEDKFVEIVGETRSCINILDPKFGSTEYLEPGCQVSKEEEQYFVDSFLELIQESSVVTLSGSAPKGMSKDIYAKLIQIARGQGKQVILDTSGELLELGMEAAPSMVKPNQDEIEMLFHTKIKSKDEVVSYAKKLYEKGIPNVVVSLGKDGALLVCKEGVFQGRPPKLKVVNTVGCGDSMVGAFAVAMERKDSPEDALQFAVAVATSNALSPKTGEFDMETCKQLLDQIVIEKL